MKGKSITFIGMSGVGKTTFGKRIAKKLNTSFIDTDHLIEETSKSTLTTIIEKNGESYFLNLEENIICNTTFPKNCIISTGGSVVYSKKTMLYLRQLSTIVYLKDSIENIQKRVKKFTNRGIIMNEASSLEDLHQQRNMLYKTYANITIQVPTPFNVYKAENHILSTLNLC